MLRAMTARKSVLAALALSSTALVGCSSSNDDPISSLRVFHTVPDAPPVNLTLNGSQAVSDLDYGESTGFVSVRANTYDVDVNAITPGSDTTVIEVDGLALAEGSRTTVFATGTVDASDDADSEKQLGVLVVPQPTNLPAANEVNLQVVHAAPVAADVDIYVTAFGADITMATPIDADYLDIAELAAPVPAADGYQVQITEDGNAANVLYDSGSLNLTGFAGQSLVVVALNSATPTTQAASPVKLVALNDATQVEFLDTDTQAAAKIVHLSPDAGDDAGGPVEVFANNAVELISAFSYGDIVSAADTYALVDSGDYVFDVSPNNDANDDSIYTSPTLTLGPGSETTVLAVGYVTPPTVDDPAFELITSSDSNRSYATQARVKVIHGAAAVSNVDVYVEAAGDFNSTNVTTSSTALLSNVPYKGDSGYLDLAAGTYDIFIAAAGTNTVAIEVTGVVVSAGDVLSLVARGADESAGATLTTASLVVLTN